MVIGGKVFVIFIGEVVVVEEVVVVGVVVIECKGLLVEKVVIFFFCLEIIGEFV